MANVIQFRTVAKEASLTADCPEDFPYEAKPELRDPAVREGYWRVAMGLQEVDGLKPSPYLRDLAREHVSGVRGLDETGSMIRAYHARQKADGRDEAAGECEADLVSQRIVELLASGAFALVPDMLAVIHGALFQDLDAATYRPGEYKTEALQKREFVLNGDSVVYADPSLIERSLAFLFDEERSHVYGIEFDEAQLEHLGRFIARLWQVHPFVEGNTRTTAVFAVLYLHDLGFDMDNEPFERHARYFRDALVRADYRNAKAGVLPDLRFVVRFLDNLLNEAEHELRSRDLACKALFDDPSFCATSIRRKRSACREALPFPVAQRLLYEALEVRGEALAIVVFEGGGTLRPAALAAHFLLLVADVHVEVDGGQRVHAPAHADGPGVPSQRHGGQPDVLRHHDVSGFQLLHDGEVGRVGADAHGQRVHPEPVAGLARISAPDVPSKVLRRVARNDRGQRVLARNGQGFGRDRAGVGVDVDRRSHGLAFFRKIPVYGTAA